ncbi:SdpI family protein [Thermoproteota archaeon]
MRKINYLFIIIILATLIASIYFYDDVPDQVPTHWNTAGEVDDYSSKAFGMFMMPGLLILMYALYLVVPRITVFKKNFDQSRKAYDCIFSAIFLFFLLMYAATLFASLGYAVKINYIVMVGIALLFYCIGHALKFVKRNFFMGIRTPWTLSSDIVWKKTHDAGSMTFRLNALVIIIAMLVPAYSFALVIGSILANVIGLLAYSYILFQKHGKKVGKPFKR